jgi:hypothetical protein
VQHQPAGLRVPPGPLPNEVSDSYVWRPHLLCCVLIYVCGTGQTQP